MPDDLRAQVKALAAREGRSMNGQIVHVLKNAVEAAEKTASNHTA
jgi:plasmid stability protein